MSDAEKVPRREEVTEGGGSIRFVTLGRITGPFGVQGWVKIHSDTEPRENIVRYSLWHLSGSGRNESRRVEQGRRQGKGVVAKLVGCDDRDAAERLRGLEISVRRDQFSESLETGEYYWADLEGLQVVDREGLALGTLEYLFETGSNDVMVVRGDRERLIPYIWEQVVLDVDLEARRMRVDWDPEF